MANGRMRVAGLVLLVIAAGAVGCGSVGEGNSLARSKERVQSRNATSRTKYLQDRQKSTAQRTSDKSGVLPGNALASGPRYLHDTGKSPVKSPPPPAKATAKPAVVVSHTGRYIHDRGVSMVKAPQRPPSAKSNTKANDKVTDAKDKAKVVQKEASEYQKWWASRPN